MTTCKKCGNDILSWQTWYYHEEPYCEKCFDQLIHEDIQKKRRLNYESE